MPEENQVQPLEGEANNPSGTENKLTYEDALAALEAARGEAAKHRIAHGELKKQVAELLPKAEKGSELERSLTELTSKLDATEKRAVFAEEAVKQDCRNPKAAYALAMAEGLFTTKGAPDWQAIRAVAPELFGKTSATAGAGAGTGGEPPKQETMNQILRRGIGVK